MGKTKGRYTSYEHILANGTLPVLTSALVFVLNCIEIPRIKVLYLNCIAEKRFIIAHPWFEPITFHTISRFGFSWI